MMADGLTSLPICVLHLNHHILPVPGWFPACGSKAGFVLSSNSVCLALLCGIGKWPNQDFHSNLITLVFKQLEASLLLSLQTSKLNFVVRTHESFPSEVFSRKGTFVQVSLISSTVNHGSRAATASEGFDSQTLLQQSSLVFRP